MFRSHFNKAVAGRKGQQGFTMVEAAVVLLIVAIIAAFVVP